MKPGYSLELVQSQRLALTPELRQAITVLQLNVLELREFVRQEIQDNPLLELSDEPTEDFAAEIPAAEHPEEDWSLYFCDSSDLGPVELTTDESESPLENLGRPHVTLREHLLNQLGMVVQSPEEYKLGELIIGNLDDNGYLRCSPSEIAAQGGVDREKVLLMIRTVQSFDPPGVAARDLRECLLLQAKARGLDGLVVHLIRDHLMDLAKGRYHKIARQEKVPLEEVLSARETILQLDPKPGSRFFSGEVGYVLPDVIVKNVDGELLVMMNDSALPRLRWNQFYRSILATGDAEVRSYLAERLKRAQCLLRNIEQRRITILKVMESLVKWQRPFFESGPSKIQPLTLKDVANELGVHESTVSRAVANKYVETPFGLFPCKLLFSPKVSSGGQAVSQHSVKKMVEEIIRSEDPSKPLADEEIARELSRRGVHVARRTVAKYRALLGIGPRNRRKKL